MFLKRLEHLQEGCIASRRSQHLFWFGAMAAVRVEVVEVEPEREWEEILVDAARRGVAGADWAVSSFLLHLRSSFCLVRYSVPV